MCYINKRQGWCLSTSLTMLLLFFNVYYANKNPKLLTNLFYMAWHETDNIILDASPWGWGAVVGGTLIMNGIACKPIYKFHLSCSITPNYHYNIIMNMCLLPQFLKLRTIVVSVLYSTNTLQLRRRGFQWWHQELEPFCNLYQSVARK